MSKAETVGQIEYSAKPPVACFGIAATRLPSQLSVPGPQAATTPIVSIPGVTGSSGRTIMFLPFTRSMSFRLSGMPWARTSSSPGPGTGSGMRSSFIAIVGSGPYSWTRKARMVSGSFGAETGEFELIGLPFVQPTSGSSPKRCM